MCNMARGVQTKVSFQDDGGASAGDAGVVKEETCALDGARGQRSRRARDSREPEAWGGSFGQTDEADRCTRHARRCSTQPWRARLSR